MPFQDAECAALNAPGKIVLYFIAVFVLGAVLAPPLFWTVRAAKGAAESRGWIYYETREKPVKKGDRPKKDAVKIMETKTRGPLRWLDAGFGKIADRATIFAAIALLVPLFRSLRIRSTAELGLERNPFRARDFLVAYSTAVGMMALLAFILLKMGLYVFKQPTPWVDLWLPAVSGLAVAFLEEWIFRGAFLGTFRRTMKPWPALAAVSALFAFVHFIQPRERPELDVVHWWSGFELLPHRFESFAEPGLLFGGFVTLFCFGWVCGWTTLRTRGLAMAIGFHAGMVLGKFGFNRIAERSDSRDLLPWLGEDLAVGLVAVGVIILVGGILWLYLRYVTPPRRSTISH
jgi:membrane protease YdiL (CAAX protease family)